MLICPVKSNYFLDGADGYHINAEKIKPVSCEEANMKCRAMNFFSHRLMIQENEDNLTL